MRCALPLIICALALAGCAKTEDVERAQSAALTRAYAGRTLGEFMTANNIRPTGKIDRGDGSRIFSFPVPCASNWHARARDAGATVDSWVVERVDVTGYCNLRT